jgi:hypothetical protein
VRSFKSPWKLDALSIERRSWPPVDDDEYPDDENSWVYWEERAAQRSFCDLRGFDPEDLGAVIAIERQ